MLRRPTLIIGAALLGVLWVCGLAAGGVQDDGQKDERYTSITAAALQQAIADTPSSSPRHERLMWRAYESGLCAAAYAQYGALVKKRPNDPYLLLWRGVMARIYFMQGLLQHQTGRARLTLDQRLMREMDQALTTAAKKLPRSSMAQSECGYYLFQLGNQIDKGLKQMREAVRLDPQDPVAQALLGRALSNPSGPFYAPAEAEEHLRTAAQLDPSYAGPYGILARLYRHEKKGEAAEQAQREYEKRGGTN